jgi:regulator of cell morphogenesis and NO signaling
LERDERNIVVKGCRMEFHSNSKVGEIAAASMAAIRVFENFGIDYCCGGEQSITEACQLGGVDPEALLQAVRDTMLSAAPETRDWKAEPLSALIGHIVSVHHGYLKLELPRIQERLEVVYATHRERDGATLAPLPEIFFPMKDELELHMHKEERMLFPAIEESERAAKGGCLPPFPFGSLANPIRVMLAEHESAGASLDQIRAITKNYELPSHACETYRALFKGFESLERDLHMHIHLENNILFPRALALQP